ncbi:MAG: DUF4199 domain-containing protein [Bacteroidales bacterium]|nr:DUF4199 domain-containing protein [Bacteroidales bacterium]
MSKLFDKKASWNEAAVAGLALGGFTIGITLLSSLTGHFGEGVMLAMVKSVLSFLLWAAKFAGCIWLMAFFMKRLVARYDAVGNDDTRRFGTQVALLSAVLVAGFSLAQFHFMEPETLRATIDTALASYPMKMDSNTMAAMDKAIDALPTTAFFVTLLYCWLYGTIVSAILSRNIPSRNPFDQPSSPDDTLPRV